MNKNREHVGPQESSQKNCSQEEADPEEPESLLKPVSTFRRVLPQILAGTAKNLLILDLGMTLAYPTFVIPVFLNAKTGLSFTKTQASWFGSISFICQPLGSVLSGIVLEPLGRKYSMLLVNVPHIIGWYLFYSAESLVTIFTAMVIMGLGVGFMEAPIMTYVGEITEPRFRGMLSSYAIIFAGLGYLFIDTMGNLTDWRYVAAISIMVPVITIIAITQVPETPLWLLSRGRLEDAEKALCWLRGWVEPRAVRQELSEMIRYSESSQFRKPKTEKLGKVACSEPVNIGDVGNQNHTSASNSIESHVSSSKENEEVNKSDDVTIKSADQFGCNNFKINQHPYMNDSNTNSHLDNHVSEWKVRLKDVVRPEMLKPLLLVIGFFFFANFSGITAMRPFFIHVFEQLHFPISPLHATVVFSVTQFVANILCMMSVRWTGKRPMALVSLLACGIATTTTAVYMFFTDDNRDGWLPFIMFIILQFFSGFGVLPGPWMLISEVFPLRGRSLATGIAAAASYILGFGATKTFLRLEEMLSLQGVFLLYGILALIGVKFLHKMMFETEGKTLEQIEQHYNSKK